MSKRNENRTGYKKTKVGWIPEDWEAKPLGSFGLFSKGKGISNKNKKETGIPCITYGEIYTKHDFVIKEFHSFVDTETTKTGQRIKKNDILFAGSGETLNEIGKCVAYTKNIEAYAGGDIVIFSPNGVDCIYLSYSLNSDLIAKHRRRLGQGHSVVHIYSSGLKTLHVPFPPLPEQKKIAEILSVWDEAIERTRNLIDAKKRRKKALMQQLLTGKKRLPRFKEEWKTYRLSELLKQISRRIEFDDQSIYDLISVRRRSGGVFSRGKIPGHTIRTKQMYLAKRGDFLISKMQIIHGASALVTKEFDSMHISGSYIALRVRDSQKLDVYFLNWLSKTPYFYHLTYLSSYGVHIEKMTFNLRLFLKSKISIPRDIKEQRRIAEALSTADEEIETLEKKLAALEKQKRGLMQKLLTGEVRVIV